MPIMTYLIPGLIVLAFVFLILFWRSRKSSAPVHSIPANPGTEKIYVAQNRVLLLSFVLFFIGGDLGVMGYLVTDIVPWGPGIILIAAGCFLCFHSVRFFLKRKTMLQLTLTPEGIYQKPVKWYSYGRNGHIGPLSVYFAQDWVFTAYTDLSYVSLRESGFLGNTIYLVPKVGKSCKLLFVIDDNQQIVHLYEKIKSHIPNNGFDGTAELL